MTTRRLPLPDHAALLLDLDGTLLDLAATPSAVTVPAGLRDDLLIVRARLDDALAIVTGRPVKQVEKLLPGVAFAVAGEHGAAIRFAPGADLHRMALPGVPDSWLRDAAALVAAHPGALLERKTHGFAVHYRLAPDSGPAVLRGLTDILGDQQTHALLPAHMAYEVRPLGADKGTAVTTLMAGPPFAGRVPVYIGDDVTDEDGIAAARAMFGFGWRVQEAFGDAAGVRAWLADLAASA